MKNKKPFLVASLVVVGIILLVGGFLCGVLLEKKRTAGDAAKIANLQKIEKIIDSKVVTAIVARGKVSKISGRTITVSSNSESLKVFVKENATFLAYAGLVTGGQVPKATSPAKPAGFSDIRVGTQLSTTIIISPAGQAEAVSVAIYPPGS